jgi:hypothetical protein
LTSIKILPSFSPPFHPTSETAAGAKAEKGQQDKRGNKLKQGYPVCA